MNTASRSIILLVMLSAVPAASVLAQNNNPGNSAGGGRNSEIANPTYPANQTPDPALTTGRPPNSASNVPADENPTVRGATGDTVVKGDRSTITGDRRATTEQKTGEGEGGGGN